MSQVWQPMFLIPALRKQADLLVEGQSGLYSKFQATKTTQEELVSLNNKK